jgi:hypothetical protein
MNKAEFKLIFDKYKKEASECLLSEDIGYAWGDISRTLKLMNNLLAEIPKDIYPRDEAEHPVSLKCGRWCLELMCLEGKRSANLRRSGNDHSAWVIESKNGKFKDLDIGGS